MDLTTRIVRHRRARWLMVGAIAVFFAFQLQLFVRALLPLPEPYGAKFPWGMFKSPASEDKWVIAIGVTQSGEEIELPIGEVFRYRRGATQMTIADHARATRKRTEHIPWQRKQLALFLADWMKEQRGVELTWVKLRHKRVNIFNGKVRLRGLGDFNIANRNQPTPWTTTRW